MFVQLRKSRELLLGVSFTALTSLGGGAPAIAQSTQANTLRLDEVVISSEKSEGTTVYDSPGTVTVRTEREIDRQIINSPRDLVRDEPGVSIGSQPTRTGSTNYVIRGIGDNRVRVEIDGVKVPDFPVTNLGAGTYTRDFVDFDSLKRVEIIRGPASALYGSDAIGGVVAFVTKDPADYLNMVGKNWYLSEKAGIDTADRSFVTTSTGAARYGSWDSMVLYTHRQGHELTPNTSLLANQQDYLTDNALTKFIYNSLDFGTFKFTGEYLRKRVNTAIDTDEVITSAANSPPAGARVFSSDGVDTTSRFRASLDWRYPANFWMADIIDTKIYWTKVDRQELTDQYRASSATATAATQLRHSDFNFNQSILGTEVQFSGKREWLGWNHNFTYGLAADLTSTERPRNRYQTTLSTGVSTYSVAGETYPNKNFPDTITTNAGFYVQDIMQYGALRIIPAVRYDYYHLEPYQDADFMRSNLTGVTVSEQTETAISPKLGLTYDLSQNYRLFGQYAHGFRAPPYDNANFGFRNAAFGYEILPNGNLKPETSNGFEGGLRGRFNDGSSFQVSGFYNLYKDFIETVTVNEAATSPSGLIQFQYQNLSNVTIYGFEGKGEYRFHPLWSLFGSFAYAYGTNNDTGAPIDSVDPFTAVTGLRYRDKGWTIEGRTRWVAAKDRVSAPTVVTVAAHATADLLVSYEVMPRFTVNAGIFNLFDASYYDPQSVAALSSTTPNIELYKAPGRTLAMNATVRW